MAEDATKSAEVATATTTQVTSSARNVFVSADRWLTHLPVMAKCNVFNGSNIILWEKTVQAALKPRKLIQHLSEEGPLEHHPDFQKWLVEEEFVFAWLLDSIAPEHMSRYASYDTSKQLWEAIRRGHSKQGNKAKIIDLIIKSYNIKQGERSVLVYSNELRDIHSELDHCHPQSTDSLARAREATNRLCQFLQGLRPEFEIVRSQLFNRDEEPTFDEAITKVMQEESRLQALKGTIEGTAYVMKGKPSSSQYQNSYQAPHPKQTNEGKGNKEELMCRYCKRMGHIKDKCWILHPDLRPPHIARAHLTYSQQGGAPQTTPKDEGIPSTLDLMQEIQKLKSMINTSSTIIGSTSMANSGKKGFLTALSTFTNNFSNIWILDSGATDHMTPLKHLFRSYKPMIPGKHVQTADGTILPVVGIGTMNIDPLGTIYNVLYVPKLFVSLVSVQRLAKIKEYNILFDDIHAYLCQKVEGWKIGLARVQKGLYYLPGSTSHALIGAEPQKFTRETTSKEAIFEIHQRMGHPSFSLLKHMYPHLFKDINVVELICDACQLGKFKRANYPSRNNRTLEPFQIIHCDVWGPSPTSDLLGNKYFLICTDDCSRFSWVFLLKTKSAVSSSIRNLCLLIKRQFGRPVKGLRTDNAKDFLNNELGEFLTSEGIKHETSCPYTPQQNGLAERKIGDTVDKVRTLLIQAHVPTNLWGFAIMTAVHLINRLPSSSLDF